ncbi:related to phosphatidate cytidylyltransferase [Rhynchosporium agropyri]|uniref:dolichol kinase n=1 Tax=Rhynchosporium agropyri TaxID=914238 RepID=A0A1E1JUU7_9HELO|nr:related to phosphatidate cytidylyltransferase [Rhynchosporium agropyri]
MHEQLKPDSQQQSHAQKLREDAVRRLSRSPHPYHRQHFELPYGSERFNSTITNRPSTKSPLRSAHNTDDEEPQEVRRRPESYWESTNSESGTEADDEHVLKGLPAPKLRPHKGLRGVDGELSGSPSPLLSPASLDEDFSRAPCFSLQPDLPSTGVSKEDVDKAVEKFQRRRRVEVVRRSTEVGIICFVGAVLCCDSQVRHVIYTWRKELSCQFLVTSSLIILYPIRLLRHIQPLHPLKMPLPIRIPSSFEAAALIYPSSISMLVTLLLCRKNSVEFLPSIALGLSSLPKHLIPSTGGFGGSEISHWALTCLPILFSNLTKSKLGVKTLPGANGILEPEILVLLYPLHQALCVTLHYMTTTSLLTAELQLLSISLIELLLLARSPQTTILKALIWGGGVGMLVTCGRVLVWGVALARVPKWRFRRAAMSAKPISAYFQKRAPFGRIGTVFWKNLAATDSSEDEVVTDSNPKRLKLNTRGSMSTHRMSTGNGSVSAIALESKNCRLNGGVKPSTDRIILINRRHTLPSFSSLPPRSSTSTPSGRRKRAASSSVQAFFYLTQKQASIRKWLYAGYVYFCLLVLILIGIRGYVQKFALQGNEPIGWALGYLLGDLPWFRMQVVSYNLQRWICIPARTGWEHEKSCYMGWVEHLRQASFGPANTRLILCAYWLAIIIVGLAIVLRLSSIYEVDTRRKVFHFMMVAMLLPATYVDPTFAALALSLILAIFLLLDLFRASQLPPLSKQLAYFLTPYVDGRDLKGPVVISHIFLLIGCAIPLWLSLGTLPRTGTGSLAGWEVPTREVSMVSGVICVGMGDAAASLIGRRYGRRKWLWGGGKSIEGSIAFATAVGLALLLAKAWLRIGGWPANNDDSWFMTGMKSSVAAGIASLTEAVLTGGNDNVVVPVVLWLCVKGLDI